MKLSARHLIAACTLGAVAFSLFGCRGGPFSLRARNASLERYVRDAGRTADLSQARFLFDDFGALSMHALETNAVPWKVVATALLLVEAPRRGLPVAIESVPPILQRFGFIVADSIANWDRSRSPAPQLDAPLGLTHGHLQNRLFGVDVEAANIGCASCHSSVTYDASGMPQRAAWLGEPNTSINFEAYSQAVYAGLLLAVRDEGAFLANVDRVFPGMSSRERRSLRKVVMPRLRKRMAEFEATTKRAVPYPNGGPGLTNGVAALKYQLGVLDPKTSVTDEVGYTNIPPLTARAFRSALLYDGVYALTGEERSREITAAEATPERLAKLANIAAFVTVGTSGNSFDEAERQIPRIAEALRFLSNDRPQPFPGPIDSALALDGSEIFERRCAKCHGHYTPGIDRPHLLSFPNKIVSQDYNHTDPVRWQRVTENEVANDRYAGSVVMRRHMTIARTGGYMPPILIGLWASAPYLHNGSVPTLWHLLHPAQRPTRFEVGGHKLDFAKVGVAGAEDGAGTYRFPEGYQPWSDSEIYDTQTPGRSNGGHTRQLELLLEDEKVALIEYLKLL